MGKEKKAGNVYVPNREIFQRINYLYQAAHMVLKNCPSNTELVRFYMQSIKTMAKRQVLRLDPSIKRNICKKCFMLLVPGISASVRFKAKQEKRCVIRCLECNTVKCFIHSKDYKLWGQQPEAWMDQSHTNGKGPG
ncbi:ribonuclease P protein subunit p21-like [Liolophura sinensis]|uniref:ribonuclease P protein subunit p21-like n=1 Tax=Liolophura sinensis TaxID=3198878 RepID=UPI00315829E1